jgi:3-methyladenine DNA glycosylase AlkD
VAKNPEGLDLTGLLDTVESEMRDAPDRLQWAMNTCLATIGIQHPEHRPRAIDIGERLEVLKALPDSPELHLAVRAHLDRGDGEPPGLRPSRYVTGIVPDRCPM